MISGISSSTAASLSEMRQAMFNKIDTSGDGSIDKDEMTALIQQNTSTLVDGLFGNLDADQDGLISQIESDSGLAKLGQQMKHSGAGMSAVSGTQPPPPEKVFDTADVNEDGVVSKEELAAVVGQNGGNIDDLFSKVDTDDDGVISRTEDETFRQQMTEGMQQKEAANSSTTNISGFSQSWQNELLGALLKGLTASTGSSCESTSVFA
jgi:Ca2+-binding EF-hand superfamily protein